MEKLRVTTCPRCGRDVEQPATGRPRVYDTAVCRRDAEYAIRRVQALLGRAERSLTTARLARAVMPSYERGGSKDTASAATEVFWAAEVETLEAAMRTALAGLSTEDEGMG